MVEREPAEISSIFQALGDPTRRRMISALAAGERTVSELAEPFDMTLAAASKHVKVLERAGLIRREIRWRTHVCHLEPKALASAHAWLSAYERFWTARLDLLEQRLRDADQAICASVETGEKNEGSDDT
jgi:DNA-binding transcriptional ArsR family regulator